MGFFSKLFKPKPLSELGKTILESLKERPEEWEPAYTASIRHIPSGIAFYIGPCYSYLFDCFKPLLDGTGIILSSEDKKVLGKAAHEVFANKSMKHIIEKFKAPSK